MFADKDSALAAVGMLDVVPTILDTVCRSTGKGFAAVAQVTDRHWIACSVLDHISFGLEVGGELELESTICNEIRQNPKPVVIPDVHRDELYRDHHTPRQYGFRSYISYPIILPDGRFFGTLCAIHPEPVDLARPEITNSFLMFAQLIALHLSAHVQLETVETSLQVERASSGMREQFIAILGHDLRNPLANIQAGVTLLRKKQSPERVETLMTGMQQSVERMSGLIDDMLDFARGRLGDGIRLKVKPVEISPMISQVVAELVGNHPERDVTIHLAAEHSVDCDIERITQLVSNLVGNALTHGARDEPITIDCTTNGGRLTISVANGGTPIPDDLLPMLFHPFSQSKDKSRDGLGLGLFIASEIAKAHKGRLSVASSPEETRFTFTMPLSI